MVSSLPRPLLALSVLLLCLLSFASLEANGQSTDSYLGIKRVAYAFSTNGDPYFVDTDEEKNTFPSERPATDGILTTVKNVYDLFYHAFGQRGPDGYDDEIRLVTLYMDFDCPFSTFDGLYAYYCAGVDHPLVVAREIAQMYSYYSHDLLPLGQPGALLQAYNDIIAYITTMEYTPSSIPNDVPRSDFDYARADSFMRACAQSSPPFVVLRTSLGVLNQSIPLISVSLDAFNSLPDGPHPLDIDTPLDDLCSGQQPSSFPIGTYVAVDSTSLPARCSLSKIASVLERDPNVDGLVIASNNPAPINHIVSELPYLFISMESYGGLQFLNVDLQITFEEFTVPRDDSDRWLIRQEDGEDPIRDMWNPGCHGSPDRVLSPYYRCNVVLDNGGVYDNSGIITRLFAMVVDGATVDGVSVPSLGLFKAAHIWLRAMREYQSSTTDFSGHADALEQACVDLIDVELNAFSPNGTIDDPVSQSDCDALATAIEIQQLRETLQCSQNIIERFDTIVPSSCPQGQLKIESYYEEDFSQGSGGFERQVVQNNGNFYNYAFRFDSNCECWYAILDPVDAGNHSACTKDYTSLHALASPPIDISGTKYDEYFEFHHSFGFEPMIDGGVVQYRINTVDVEGTWQTLQDDDFDANGPNGYISLLYQGFGIDYNTNPLTRTPEGSLLNSPPRAYTAGDGGFYQADVRTRVNIGAIIRRAFGSYFTPSFTYVQFRWLMGADRCIGYIPWKIHQASMYSCKDPTKSYIEDSLLGDDDDGTAPPVSNPVAPYTPPNFQAGAASRTAPFWMMV